MKVLVLAPMKEELSNFKKALSSVKSENDYHIVRCGIGKVSAAVETANQLDSFEFDVVLLIGYAGSTTDIPLGSIQAPGYAFYSDANVPQGLVPELEEHYELASPVELEILTADSFVDKANYKSFVCQTKNDTALFDMECAAVAQVCSDTEIPLICVKIVSDHPEVSNEGDFNSFVETHSDFTELLSVAECLLEQLK